MTRAKTWKIRNKKSENLNLTFKFFCFVFFTSRIKSNQKTAFNRAGTGNCKAL